MLTFRQDKRALLFSLFAPFGLSTGSGLGAGCLSPAFLPAVQCPDAAPCTALERQEHLRV